LARRPYHRTCLALTLILLAAPFCRAETRHLPLAPPQTRAEFTTYAMGLWPLAGHFTQFSGDITVDPAHADLCTVSLDIDVASLEMADPERARLAVGPKLLNQAEFPKLTYRGTCAGGRAAGMLTMHGVTKPLFLTATRTGATVTATGSLKREDFGIDGMPGLIGRTIKLSFAVQLPEDVATLVRP